MIKRIKQIFCGFLLGMVVLMPIFGLEVRTPVPGSNPDLQKEDTARVGEHTIVGTLNKVNEYLRWSMGLIASVMVLYGGFNLVTAQGDKKALNQAIWSFIGAAIGVIIAMLSYVIVKIVVNLI